MGYIVGEISELILDVDKESKRYKSRVAAFESFAKSHELPDILRERVAFFFRVQFESTEGHALSHLVHQLSANLRLKFMMEIYGHSLAQLPISHFLSATQINNLALRLQSELFVPGDNIVVEGTIGNRLYMLRMGVAAVFWTKSVASDAVIMEGALYGEVAFFLPNQRRLVTVRATSSCEILHVSRHDWDELWTPSGDPSENQEQKYMLSIFNTNPGLKVDIIAILPLEFLLVSSNVRVSLEYDVSVESTWWTARWVLRANRMLFVRRIDPLLEELLQYAIYDCNLNINESVVSFLRALVSYLTMAHFLACVWFAAGDYGLRHYGISWISTSGMLTYIEPATSTGIEMEATRALLSVTSSNILESVSLSRKYLRSVYFSMQCITTLYYGDIVSMNKLEFIVEIGITFWAIYIYGALIGAQGELLDVTARPEASFEQHLVELQLYLVQNEVPKALKRQIKAYYAHMWQHSSGKSVFAVIDGVSRALHEDVVLATLQDFAVRVEVFRILDEPCLRALLVCLQYVVCSEGEDVVVAGDVDRSMYFIAQGRILVKIGKAEIPREREEFFGELALLYGISRLETCVAMTVAELYRLDHEPYERLLVDFPEYRIRNKLSWTTTAAAS